MNLCVHKTNQENGYFEQQRMNERVTHTNREEKVRFVHYTKTAEFVVIIQNYMRKI